jgi:hypothetical protein
MPMSHDAHQAPKMPAMIAIRIRKSAAPVLLTHFDALTPSKPNIRIESPHQNAVIAYTGYQIKAKIPSMANPPAIMRIMLPIKAKANPMFDVEEAVEASVVEVSDKSIHLQKSLFLLAYLNGDSLGF